MDKENGKENKRRRHSERVKQGKIRERTGGKKEKKKTERLKKEI